MIGAQDNAGGWTYYGYDGDGKRVKINSTTSAANGFRRQVYGFEGELVADYSIAPGGRAHLVNLTGEYGYRNGELLVKATIGTTLTPDGGGGFETPVVGAGNYQNNPTGAGWTFSGSTGVSGNGSALTLGNANAPEGNQVAFIQGGGSAEISQLVGGLTAGATYAVTFSAAQRANCCSNGGEDFQVFVNDASLGSALLGTFRPGSSEYQDYVTAVFSPTRNGTFTQLRFVGLNSSGGDNTAFIDNVRVTVIDNVEWLVSDQLGTPRMIFDKTGALASVKRHDYLPFGEELSAGVGLRSPTQGYGAADGVRQKFTQKERDVETGLDYFGARYYSSTQGRFTSPDEFTGGPHEVFGAVLPPDPLLYAEPAEPESFNKYNYCLGNPLRYIDPDGHQTKQADALIVPTPQSTFAIANALIGVAKEGANIWIGMANTTAAFTGGKQTPLFKESNNTQGLAMDITADVAFIGAFLSKGPASVGGVAIADAEETAIVSQVGNGTRTASESSGAAAQTPKEGIYEFRDAQNPGKTYVGQSGNMPQRLGTHGRSGRLASGETPSTTTVGGGRISREMAEQNRINQLGGTRNVPGSRTSNIRNPVSHQRQRKLDNQ